MYMLCSIDVKHTFRDSIFGLKLKTSRFHFLICNSICSEMKTCLIREKFYVMLQKKINAVFTETSGKVHNHWNHPSKVEQNTVPKC